MKTLFKILPVIAGSILLVNSTSAQTTKRTKAPTTPSNFSIGVKGGPQFSSFNRFGPINTRIGWNAGLSMTYSAWEHWGVGGDIMYTRTGGYYSVDRGAATNTRHTVRTDYVRIVPKVTYFFMGLENRFRPKIFVGPNFGILTMAVDKNRQIGMYNEYKPVEIGITGGVGFNYRVASAIWLTFDAEYLYGFNKINDVTTFDPVNLHTSSLGASVGLAFGVNRLSGKNTEKK